MGGYLPTPAAVLGNLGNQPYYAQANTTDAPRDRYPNMSVLPEGVTVDRVIGRFYIACLKSRLPWRTRWMVYELCEDLAFRAYAARYRSPADAHMTAWNMFHLSYRPVVNG